MQITLFDLDTDAQGRSGEFSWRDFAESLSDPAPADTPKKALPLWSPVQFTGDYRHGSRVVSVHALSYDVDEAPIPDRATLEAALAGHRAVAHSSSSATAAMPRWRAVFALSRPVTGDEYRRIWPVVATSLGFPVGQASKDPSRAWYVPRRGVDGYFEHFVTDGAPLDVDALLASAPATPAPRAPTPAPPSKPTSPTKALAAKRAAAACLLAAAWPDEGCDARLALAGALARDRWSVDEATAFFVQVHEHLPEERRAAGEPRIVAAAYEKHAKGEAVTGWTRLGELVGVGVASAARGLLDVNADIFEGTALGSAMAPEHAPRVSMAAMSAPVPVPAAPAQPAGTFPLDALPAPLRTYVAALAEATQTPLDMAAMLTLGACSGAIAGKAEIDCGGWREPLNLYVVVALPPSERKSSTFADVFGPLYTAERQKAVQAAARIAETELKVDQIQALVKKKTQELLRLGEEDDQEHAGPGKAGGAALKRQILELEERLRDSAVPNEPRLLCDDVTMERLAELLSEQDGRMICASAEGALFSIIAGRYSSGVSFEVLLKGHSGDELSVDRKGNDRKAIRIARPCLTLVFAVQPDVLEQLAEDKRARGRGLLARFLYVLPTSRVGTREQETEPVPDAVRAAYAGVVQALCDVPTVQERGTSRTVPVLTLSPEAYQAHVALRRALEPRLGKDGDLFEISYWAGKWAGAVARIAGVLHAVQHGPTGAVSGECMRAAIAIGEYLLRHALQAFGLMNTQELEKDCEAVLEWARKSKLGRFKRKWLCRSIGTRALRNDPKRREAALKELVERGQLLVVSETEWEILPE